MRLSPVCHFSFLFLHLFVLFTFHWLPFILYLQAPPCRVLWKGAFYERLCWVYVVFNPRGYWLYKHLRSIIFWRSSKSWWHARFYRLCRGIELRQDATTSWTLSRVASEIALPSIESLDLNSMRLRIAWSSFLIRINSCNISFRTFTLFTTFFPHPFPVVCLKS